MKITTVTNRQMMISLVFAVGLATATAIEAPPPTQTTLPELTPQVSAEAPVAAGVRADVVQETGSNRIQELSPEAIYGSLAPHGEWYHLAAFGWCWQPRSWLDTLDDDSHVWGLLGYGSWSNFRTLGWCWVPSRSLGMSSYLENRDGLPRKPGSLSSGLDAESFHWVPVSQFGGFSTPLIIGYGPSVGGFSYGGPVGSAFGGGFYDGASAGSHGGTRRHFHSGGFHGRGGGGFHSRGGGSHGGGRGHR